MPLTGRLMNQAEWDQMRKIAQHEMPRNCMLYQLGHMLRCVPTKVLQQTFWRELPLPVRLDVQAVWAEET